MNRVFLKFVLLLLVLCSGSQILAGQGSTQKFDFSHIREQALLSHAAYLSEEQIHNSTLPPDYSLDLYHELADIQISFILVSNEALKTQTIAVRGTANIENAILDLALKLVLDKSTNIYLHQGFSNAARQVYTGLKPFLKKDYRINTTGHSLGGAVAMILAAILDGNGFEVNQVTTFGQPKVTNLSGASSLDSLDIIRVVTDKDIVPLVPLFDPLDINDLDIYWHAGIELILLDGNQYAVLQGVNSMLRATRFTQQALNEANLQHHQMQVYLRLIDAKIETAREVVYETSLNLFNLFGSE
ncbi:MAG: lipase family protein [Proteobacteria bacterium]|nr:lipase family protein [Pseudomonadota bacterium]